MNLQLTGKCCLVTGGTRNLGRAIVLALLEEGASVVTTYRRDHSNAEQLLRVVTSDAQSRLSLLNRDISREAECRDLCNHAVDRFGRFDVLINNAAVTLVQSPDAITDDEFDTVFHNTLRSTIYMSRAAADIMRRLGGGRIVNMSTAGVFTANPNELLYVCAKAGVEAATRAFARREAKNHVTVNAIAAHVISSGMGLETTAVDPTIIGRIPLRRMGRIEELVSLVLYLASPLCEYMTGQVLHLNGGRLMQ